MTDEIIEPGAEITAFDEIDAGLAALKSKFKDKVYDVSTIKGLGDARADRAELRSGRTAVDKIKKALKAPHLEAGRRIEEKAKEIKATFAELEEPLAKIIKEEEDRKAAVKEEKEEAERKRISDIYDRIGSFKFTLSEYHPSDMIQGIMDNLNAYDIDESFDEFVEDAQRAMISAKNACSTALDASLNRESIERTEKAEAAAKEERLAREQNELDEQRKADAEEKRKRDMEAAAEAEKAAEIKAKEDAERDRELKEKIVAEWRARMKALKYKDLSLAIDHISDVLNDEVPTDAEKLATIREIVDANLKDVPK